MVFTLMYSYIDTLIYLCIDTLTYSYLFRSERLDGVHADVFIYRHIDIFMYRHIDIFIPVQE